MSFPAPNVLWTLAAMVAALGVGSVVRLTSLSDAAGDQRRQRLARLRTWWGLALVTVLAVLTGSVGVCVLLGVVSLLGLREYTGMLSRRKGDRYSIYLIYLFALGHYGWIAMTRPQSVSGWLIVAAALTICCLQLIQGETKHYVRSTAGLLWGALLVVIAPAHAAMLTVLPDSANPVAGQMGYFLYLILLTEVNDIAQALVGRQISQQHKHAIAPTVSPNKSWEGFVGGVVTSVVLSVLLAPALTPLGLVPVPSADPTQLMAAVFWPAVAGLIISVSGYVGDINMSAVKRDVGVKDSSDALPGMGGILDRIDSLTFTAPSFYYFVQWLVP